MRIVWDEPKRIWNREKHDLDFSDLDGEFFLEAMIVEAKERRFKAVGFLSPDIIAVVFATPGREGISVISMRPASRQERRLYEEFQSQDSNPH